MKATRMCDLPQELVGEEILSRIPITSLGAVRSTCKSWEALTKRLLLGKAATATQQFMTMNSKLCSLSLVDLSVKPVALLNQVEMRKVFHCDGLLLCIAKDKSKLVVWNPYLCQTRWIGPRTEFHYHDVDNHALGYDTNRNHKILRFVDNRYNGEAEHIVGFEIYELSSNSWRVLEVTPDWEIDHYRLGVSVKGNTYWYAHERICDIEPEDEDGTISDMEDFLLCFDFTTERFGPRLPLPFHNFLECVTLSSCARDEQLAVLYFQEGINYNSPGKLEIWVTTRIEPNCVSWSKFLAVDIRPYSLTCVRFDEIYGGSFFLDEQEKVAVVIDLDAYLPTKTARYHTAYIIGENGYFESVSLGEAPRLGEVYYHALVCSSSYRPSLVQVIQPQRKRKRHV